MSIKKITIIAASALFLATGCTAPERSKEALDDAGYTDIQTTGHVAFQCSEDDTYATGFKATNPRGKVVRGTVCCGFNKGCTIRH